MMITFLLIFSGSVADILNGSHEDKKCFQLFNMLMQSSSKGLAANKTFFKPSDAPFHCNAANVTIQKASTSLFLTRIMVGKKKLGKETEETEKTQE